MALAIMKYLHQKLFVTATKEASTKQTRKGTNGAPTRDEAGSLEGRNVAVLGFERYREDAGPLAARPHHDSRRRGRPEGEEPQHEAK